MAALAPAEFAAGSDASKSSACDHLLMHTLSQCGSCSFTPHRYHCKTSLIKHAKHLSASTFASAGFEDWEVAVQWPFVEQSKSPRALYRAFYLPQMSQRVNHVSDYVVLKRKERRQKQFWSRQRM